MHRFYRLQYTKKAISGGFYLIFRGVLYTEGKFQVVFTITVGDIYLFWLIIRQNSGSRSVNLMYGVFVITALKS